MTTNKTLYPLMRIPAHSFYDDGGDGGGDPVPFDLNAALKDPESKKKLQDWAERELVSGVKAKNEELLGKLTRYKVKDADTGEETYIDPEVATQAIEFMNTEGKDINSKIEKAVSEANKRAENQVNSLQGQLDKANATAELERKARIDKTLGYELKSALLESGIKQGKLPMHQMYLMTQVSVDVDENGHESIIIKGDDGNLRYGKDGPMTLKEFIEEYRDKDDISDDWEADVMGGSGQPQGDGIRRTGPKIDQDLSPQERLRQYRQQAAKKANARSR